MGKKLKNNICILVINLYIGSPPWAKLWKFWLHRSRREGGYMFFPLSACRIKFQHLNSIDGCGAQNACRCNPWEIFFSNLMGSSVTPAPSKNQKEKKKKKDHHG
ncbi:hypothetical protein Ancab_036329 [Ancistrocladus abbreviatus]